jgi:putative intracellular protease/amidase
MVDQKGAGMDEKCCGLTRRHYLKGGAAMIAATGLGSLASAETMGGAAAAPASGSQSYRCPPCGLPCDQLVFDKPGKCPNCGMTLVPENGQGVTKVAILVFNGAEIIDFAGPWEVFGTARFLVHTVGPKLEPVSTVFGQKLVPDYAFENSPKADILLVPGGAVLQYFDDKPLIGWIRAKANDVDHVMSVCTGAYLLQKAGLLAGQTVTATNGMIEDFAAPDTRIVYDRRYVDNGKILTTAGLSAGIDGALHLVSKIRGVGVAQSVALAMEYPWEPDGKWARAALADRYLPQQLTSPDGELAGVKVSLISTEGNTDRWETRLLFSEPATDAQVMTLLRKLIAANQATGGMFKPVAHIKGPSVFAAAASNSRLEWSFTDDQDRRWKGVALTGQGDAANPGLVATLKLARDL